MTQPQHVAVVGGGQNSEHNVSLASAASIATALRDSGFIVHEFTIGRDGVWSHGDTALAETPSSSLAAALGLLDQVDVIFPALHGLRGEDGTLAALCELTGKPYVGSPVSAGAIAIDKWATKMAAAGLGIAVSPGVLVGPQDEVTWDGPRVVKPVAAGSSHGVSLVRDREGLTLGVKQARELGERVLVEEVMSGREIDVAVTRTEVGEIVVAPPLEIMGDGIFDTDAKYDGSAVFEVPARLAPELLSRLSEIVRTMYLALECDGVARMDFFVVGESEQPILNEVNTMPGMTAHSQVPRMFAAAGWSYPELVSDLVRGAWKRSRRL